MAVPTEFDGIRTQISKELNIPKTAVKKIVKEYREKLEIPSWWDLQTYKGDEEEKAKIKAIYEPYLPLPPVGIHKKIAEELSLQPGDVYQAIKAIRLDMNLPQYNDPALHGLELQPRKKAQKAEGEEQQPATQASTEGDEPLPAAQVSTEGDEPLPVAQASTEGDEPLPVAKGSAESLEQQQAPEAEESAVSTEEQPAGEITSIETDITFHKESDTLEVTDQSTPKEGEHTETVATATAEGALSSRGTTNRGHIRDTRWSLCSLCPLCARGPLSPGEPARPTREKPAGATDRRAQRAGLRHH